MKDNVLARPNTNKNSLAQNMCQALEDDIVSGILPPGKKLEEQFLVERFKCSRTPVREALHLLCATDLVERRRNQGVFVAMLTPTRMLQIFETMAEMEALCGKLCVMRMTAKERGKLRDLHQTMRSVVQDGNAEEYRMLNQEFHKLIYKGVKNESLVDFSRQARRQVASYRRVQFNDLRRLSSSHAEHDDFVKAVESGNAQKGSLVLYEHIMSVKDVAMEFLYTVNEINTKPKIIKRPLSNSLSVQKSKRYH